MIGVGQMRTIRSVLALALALAGGGSFAQSVQVGDSAFQRFLINTTGVGQQTVGFTGTGQPVPQLSGHTLSPDGAPGVRASATGILRNSAGGQIPVSLAGRVTPAVVARFIGRAVPLLGAAVLASDIADFASEQGYQLGYSNGAVTVSKLDPTACTSAPCYGPISGRVFGSALAACQAYAATVAAGRAITNLYTWNERNNNFLCDFRAGAQNYSQLIGKTNSVPSGGASLPSSVADFEQFLLQGNPYPVSSSVAEAIIEARDLLGEPIPLAQPQVSGPATSPGSTSTTTKPDGSTVTITQTFNHTYNGPNISTTTTTTTSTVPAGGGPVQTETTVQTPEPVQQEPEPFTMPCGVPGAPPCSVKVDETGVPTTVEDLADPQQRVDETLQPLSDLQADPIGFWPELPELTWNFALPTNCDVIPVPVFEEWMPPIDLCQFQPMFHSLMSVVWVLGGLFGAISLFWRNTLSTV